MKILFVKNNNERDEKFQIRTIIYENKGKKYVRKEAMTDKAIPHLMKMPDSYKKLSKLISDPKIKLAKVISKNKNSLIFEYIEGESLEKKFYKIYQKNDLTLIYKFLDYYIDFLKKGFKMINNSSLSKSKEIRTIFGDLDKSSFKNQLCFEGISNIDLIFTNIILKNNIAYIIDYEWVFDFEFPINYTIFRSIQSLYTNNLIKSNDRNTIFKKYHLENKYDDIEKNFLDNYVYKVSFSKYSAFYKKKNYNIIHALKEKEFLLKDKDLLLNAKKLEIQKMDRMFREKENEANELRFSKSYRFGYNVLHPWLIPKKICVHFLNLFKRERKILVHIEKITENPQNFFIEGWCFSLIKDTVNIELDGIKNSRIHRIRREDVGRLYKNYPQANESGFYFEINRSKRKMKLIFNDGENKVQKQIIINRISVNTLKKMAILLKGLIKKISISNFKKGIFLFKHEGIKALINQLFQKINPESSFSNKTDLPYFSDEIHKLNKIPFIPKINTNLPIDIIIPVYNGFEFLQKLIQSIRENTTIKYRLILINDKSTDKKIYHYLKNLKKKISRKNIGNIILENEENLGFVKTVNKGIEQANNHFVILNTDTEVPKYWLERLMYPIFQLPKIASTTPFTNSGTICSFPVWLKDNESIEGLDVNGIDRYFRLVDFEKNNVEIPTGVGFCMGINRDVIKKIGMFDEVIFAKGYGEENDWSMRAQKNGYKNIIVPNLYIYHKHGGSFVNDEKKILMEMNLKIIKNKHRNYQSLVQEFIKQDSLKGLRSILIILIACTGNEKNYPILIIDHKLGGGANEFSEKLVQNRLSKNKIVFLLYFDFNLSKYIINFSYKNFHFEFLLNKFSEIILIAKKFQIRKVIINQLVTFPDISNTLKLIKEKIIEELNVNCFLYVHDYFFICPSFNLLDYKINFCNIPPDIGYCENCLKINPMIKSNTGYLSEELKEFTIEQWRKSWEGILAKSTIICFSESSKNLLLKAYPEITKRRIKVRYHKVDWMRPVSNKRKNKEKLRIGILGILTVHKGLNVVREMASLVKKNNLAIEFIVFGEIIENFKNEDSEFIVLGKYEKEKLADLIEEYQIDIIFISSICPETFSYTTEEAIKMEMPLAVFDLGAPAERVKKYNKGFVIEKIDAKFALEKFSHWQRKKNKINNSINKKIQIVTVVSDFFIFESTIKSSVYMNRFELNVYDNTVNNISIPKRNNDFIKNKMKKDTWIIFCHQDFSFLENIDNKLMALDKKFIYGPIGAKKEGKKVSFYGEINQGHKNEFVKHGKYLTKPHLVETLDCQCLIVHSSLIKDNNLLFDEALDFHHYAEEFCLNAKYNYNILSKAIQIECQHLSYGNLSKSFYDSVAYVKDKYNHIDYASTCPI